MSPVTDSLRDGATALLQRIEEVEAKGEEAGLEDEVALALALTRLEDAAKMYKEDIKTRLREDAAEKQPEQALNGGQVEYSTPTGRITVTFVKPAYRVKRGADMDAVQSALGDDFPTVFRKKVTWLVQPEGLKGILEHPDQEVVFEALSSSATPRVGFRTKK